MNLHCKLPAGQESHFMKTIILMAGLFLPTLACLSQQAFSPELLWKLGRISGDGISSDGTGVVYHVTSYDASKNTSKTTTYRVALSGGSPVVISDATREIPDKRTSPDGRYAVRFRETKVERVAGSDFYPDLDKSNAMIYETLNYRHWDKWEDGNYSHLFLHKMDSGKPGEGKDIMPDEPYDCPQKPFGDEGDFAWSPDSRYIVYVCKKKYGTDYATSTNTDLYQYNAATGKTRNLTEGMMGYDVSPSYSSTGVLAWLSMKRDGYESDKNDIIVDNGSARINLTQSWDGTVSSYRWSDDSRRIFFTAPANGTIQLFQVDYPGKTKKLPQVRPIASGDFDVKAIVGQSGNMLVVTREDMNHAAELYTVDLKDGTMKQLTFVNEELYKDIVRCKIERRYVTTTDGKQMLVWLIYPPGFTKAKKYPTLLYCQGGPQSALTQFYSFRWNFQLMAANGYIIVAPCRRGMPGFGVVWNEEISKDHGGQAIRDYLSAIDEISKEGFVDENRLGCVGASYGGYSVFYLAGIHRDRFKTFIAHDGIFDNRSMYGTTEELWFVNWDLGGPYWDKSNQAAQKSYTDFDPSNMVDKWNTPIFIIQGGKDFRVPVGQGLAAFQAAQLQGIKSKLLYFPEENHWVLSVQNGLIWQREFFKWLHETL